jgi:hypothetical protein
VGRLLLVLFLALPLAAFFFPEDHGPTPREVAEAK